MPAFTVVAKWFRSAEVRRRALTAVTLAALASCIFLPLSQALIDARGWRDALVFLAVILAVVTLLWTHSSCARPMGSVTRRTRRADCQQARRYRSRDDDELRPHAFLLAPPRVTDARKRYSLHVKHDLAGGLRVTMTALVALLAGLKPHRRSIDQCCLRRTGGERCWRITFHRRRPACLRATPVPHG